MANSNDPSYWANTASPILQSIAERSYYALPGVIKSKVGNSGDAAADLSATNAQTRGAQYAQERRINQIKQNRGDTVAFDPRTQAGGQLSAQDSAFISKNFPLANDPQLGANRVRGGVAIGEGIQNAIGSDRQDIQNQMNSLQPYMQQRYTADATNAGTLGNTAQSRASLGADVSAGMEGARTALNSQNDVLNAVSQPNWTSNTMINPTPTGTSAMTAGIPNSVTQQPSPLGTPLENVKPENTLSGAGVASGQTNVTPQARINAIQAKRAR